MSQKDDNIWRSLCLLKLFAHVGQDWADTEFELVLGDGSSASLFCDGVAWLDTGR
ncbi:hypothetical protein INS49_009630 [Diaporthe citri]|uniref:uncharacterized protein n=1 Tax=Diaporthe citri TaxID=83186 RepID=UPI001C80AEDC|nr:uncharacterized protein INS49_009630 [Diaporthe citri]KAG6361403.1 hypothetical protein INS49_009630 [Diaporthe citri]